MTDDRPAGAGDILALGFGSTTAMWTVGYFCRLPTLAVPTPVVGALMLVCLIGGGVVAGAWSPRGRRAGLYAGLLAAVLNLLILGGLLGRVDQPNRVVPSAAWWAPGSVLVGMALCGLGSLVGAGLRSAAAQTRNWTGSFATVAASATLLLLAVGGMVTGYQEGLAVVDWPNSYGCNMFLYPLSRMTGGIYYEHAHRLIGSLVGLTTVVLAVHLWRVDRRGRLRALAIVAVLMVIVQGVLGGLRVTGRFTLSTQREDVAPSIALAIVHGVFGQMFFAVLVALRAFVSTTWRSTLPPSPSLATSTDRTLSAWLVALLIVQLVLGAILRHIAGGLHMHITLAVVVALLTVACGSRAWGLHADRPVLPRIGRWMLALVGVQVVLGIAALAVTGITAVAKAPGTADVVITGLHQLVGALLLASAVMLLVWNHRLLSPADSPCYT